VVKGGEGQRTTGPRQRLAGSREEAVGSNVRSDRGLQGPTITRGDTAAATESKSSGCEIDKIADRTIVSTTMEATNHTTVAAAVRAGSTGGGTLTTLRARLTGSTV